MVPMMLAASESADPTVAELAPAITTLVVFGIVILILFTKVWPKITSGLDERQTKIRQEIEAAEASQAEARAAMEELSSSLGKETKSTAGDKHETGRAMVQREMEQAGERLARCEVMHAVASRLDLDRNRTSVGPGAIVVSGETRLLIGVGLGPFEVPGIGRFHAISADAPIAVALSNGRAGEQREFRGRSWGIQSVD